jgi:regulator of replication initiation timing
MEKLVIQINAFQEKLKSIQEKINNLKNENQLLNTENKRLKELMKIQNNTIKKLEDDKKIKNLSQLALSKKDKTTLKHSINHLIEEIDDCIRSLQD